MYHYISEVTGGKGSDVPSKLVLVITCSSFEIEDIVYRGPPGKSDHLVPVMDYLVRVKVIEEVTQTKRKKEEGNNAAFKHLLQGDRLGGRVPKPGSRAMMELIL